MGVGAVQPDIEVLKSTLALEEAHCQASKHPLSSKEPPTSAVAPVGWRSSHFGIAAPTVSGQFRIRQSVFPISVTFYVICSIIKD